MPALKRRIASSHVIILMTLICISGIAPVAFSADEMSLCNSFALDEPENLGRVCDAFPDAPPLPAMVSIADRSALSITEMTWVNDAGKPLPSTSSSSDSVSHSRFQLAAASSMKRPMSVGRHTKVFQPAKPHGSAAGRENVMPNTLPSIAGHHRWQEGLAAIKIDDLVRKSPFPKFERIDKSRTQFKFPFRVFLLPLFSLAVVMGYHHWLRRLRHPRHRYFY